MDNIVKNIRRVGKVCGYQMALQFHEARTRAVFLILFLYLWGILSPVKEFAAVIDQQLSPWFFVVLMNDTVCSMIVFCLWCFLICDVPFRNDSYLYYAGRAGKMGWIWGEILFLFVFSGVFLLVVYIFTVILSIPRLDVTLEWGKVLGTLAYTDASFQFPVPVSFPVTVMSGIAPPKAALISFLLAWLAVFLLGMSVLFFNWCFRSSLGAAAGLFWIFLDITAENILDHRWLRFSPVSLSRLSNLMGRYQYLTPVWVLAFSGGILLLLTAVICVVTRRRKGMEGWEL